MADGAGERRQNKRHYLGKARSFGHTVRMFQTREAIEVDEVEGYEVTRRRVFYDDVLLVTYHQFVGWSFIVAAGLLTAVFALMAFAFGLADRTLGLIVFLVTGLPFLIALVVRLILKVDAVTVYGRRTKAQIHFAVRKARARAVFNQINRAVKETQDRIAREIAPRPPRPAAAPPPPPSAPPS